MDSAADNGHFEIVKYLNLNRSEGCSVRAMDSAAENGHFEIVKYLNLNRSEGCTDALLRSTKKSYFKIVKYLVENNLGRDHLLASINVTDTVLEESSDELKKDQKELKLYLSLAYVQVESVKSLAEDDLQMDHLEDVVVDVGYALDDVSSKADELLEKYARYAF